MKKIVVFGSFITDLTAYVDKMPILGETLMGKQFRIGPGGKGSNQGIAAHRAGVEVIMAVRVGTDIFSNVALDFYGKEGLSIEYVIRDPAHQTGIALIEVDTHTGQNEIVVVPGACNYFSQQEVEKVGNLLDENTILVTQLEINEDANEQVIAMAKQRGSTVILNPAPAHVLPVSLLRNVDIVTPNETETKTLTGIDVQDGKMASLRRAARFFFNTGVQKVVITLGSKGAYCNNGTEEFIIPAYQFGTAVDCTGAGDAFNGGLAAGLAKGMSFADSARYAAVIAGLSVTRYGTAPAMPIEKEIDEVYTTLSVKE